MPVEASCNHLPQPCPACGVVSLLVPANQHGGGRTAPLVTLIGCLTSRICDILLATPITNTPIYLLLDSCGSNFCGSAPVTGTSAMYSLKPPIIMEPLRLSKQQLEGVVKHATLAQESEVSAGNIVYQCKVSSDLYQYLRAKILEKQAAATSLAHNGLLPPHMAQSYSQHLADAAEDEAYNLAVQAVAVDLEAYFDEAETSWTRKSLLSSRTWLSCRASMPLRLP